MGNLQIYFHPFLPRISASSIREREFWKPILSLKTPLLIIIRLEALSAFAPSTKVCHAYILQENNHLSIAFLHLQIPSTMSKINIPLEALTSRLNLGSRFEGVRSQSLTTRFSNLKPVGEFLDFKRLSKPGNFGEVQSRVNYNLAYFQSNYFALATMLAIYSLLTNLKLLFDMIFMGLGLFLIRKLDGRDLQLGVTRLTTSQLYTILFVIGVPVFIWASPIATALWLVGAIGVTVLGHASFMDKPIDTAFSEEAV